MSTQETHESSDSKSETIRHMMLQTPATQGYFDSLYSSFKVKVFRQPTPPEYPISIQEAQIMFNQRRQQSDIESIKLLSFQDFIPYLKSIQKEYKEYRKLQHKYEADKPENIDNMILECYKLLPQFYFDSNFHFNYQILGQPKDQILKHMEQISAYLDEVEITLFYQINSRFDQFLSVVLNLNDMNEMISSNIKKVQKVRKTYAQTKQLILVKSKNILNKKQQIESTESVIHILSLIQSTQKSMNQLAELINKQNYEQAVCLLKATEETYQTIKNVNCLKQLPQRLQALFSNLQQSLTSHILSILLAQLVSQNQPFKSLLGNLQSTDHEDSMLANSFYNDSFIEQSQTIVQPTFKNDQLMKLLQSAHNIIDLSDKIFRNKILEELQGYYQDFIIHIDNHLSKDQGNILSFNDQQQIEHLSDLMNSVPAPMFIQLVQFFSDNTRCMIKTQLRNMRLFENLNSNKQEEIMEEQVNIISGMLKFANERIASLISLKRLVQEVKEFIELIQIYQDWETFYKQEIQIGLGANDDKYSNKIKQAIQKCSINQLIFMRASQEKQFLTNFHKEKLQQLRKYLENETWMPADVHFEYHEILSYLFQVEDNQNEVLDESVLLNSSIAVGKSMIQQFVNNNTFKIVKTEIQLVKNNEKYKLTQAFLFFIDTTYQYIRITSQFQTVTYEQVAKITEIFKSYNSLTTQLILGAGAIHFGKLKTISARNLAISSMCLRFFLALIDPIAERILQSIRHKVDLQDKEVIMETISSDINKTKNDYLNHNLEIITKLTTLLQERFQEQYDMLKQQQWNDQLARLTTPSKFTNGIIQNTRSLYSAIEEVLLVNDLKAVFSKIILLLIQDFLQTFRQIEINSKIGFTRIKEELEYFRTSLNEIGQLPTLLPQEYSQLDKEIQSVIELKQL